MYACVCTSLVSISTDDSLYDLLRTDYLFATGRAALSFSIRVGDLDNDVAITDHYVATTKGRELKIVSRATGKLVRRLPETLSSLVALRGDVVLSAAYRWPKVWLVDLDVACRTLVDGNGADPWLQRYALLHNPITRSRRTLRLSFRLRRCTSTRTLRSLL